MLISDWGTHPSPNPSLGQGNGTHGLADSRQGPSLQKADEGGAVPSKSWYSHGRE